MLRTGDLVAASDSMPNTIKGALETPVVNDLVKAVGKPAVSRLIEFELAKLAGAVSVGGSLDNYKVQLIATQLIEFFPNESIADFKVCFFRASSGQYGDIFRLDGIVIRKFMESYLDEKYQAVEDKMMKEKDDHYKPQVQKQGTGEGYEMFKKWAADLQKSASSGIRTISQKEIDVEGGKKAVAGYPITFESYHEQRAHESAAFKEQWLNDMRKKYPGLSDEQLNTMI